MFKNILKRGVAVLVACATIVTYMPGLAFIAESPAVYAAEGDTYTITFSPNGVIGAKNMPESQTVTEGYYVTKPEAPYADGYEFMGWSATETGATSYDFGNTQVYNNVEIFAIWKKAKQYVVSYDMNGHGAQISADKYTEGEVAKVPAAPRAFGYIFGGWYTDAACTDEAVFGTVNANVTYYAKWTPIEQTDYVYVAYDVQGIGEAPEAEVVKAGEHVHVPANPQAEGYTFGGWYTDEACTDEFSFGAVDKCIKVYAKWTANEYAAKLYANGGELNGEAVIAAKHGKAFAQPADPTKAGATFAGWYSDSTLETKYDWSTKATSDIEVYAKWVKNAVEVRYDTLGVCSAPETEILEQGDQAHEPIVPIAKGYEFMGWYLDGELYDFDAPVNDCIKLTARWKKVNYTLTFHEDGGVAVDDQTAALGEQFKYVKTTKPGCKFLGWFTQDGAEYDFNTEVTADLQLFAKWEEASYTVTFDMQGHGEQIDAAVVAYNEKADKPIDPAAEGYAFAGWYTENGSLYDFSTPVTENIKIYAKWTANEYAAKLYANGGELNGEAVIAAKHGKAFAQPADPTKAGVTFAGWYSDSTLETKYDWSTKATSDIEVYAKWVKNAVEVRYDTFGVCSAPETEILEQGDQAHEPIVPIAKGYEFMGWYLDGELYDFDAPVNDCIKLTAGWKKVNYTLTFHEDGGVAVDDQTVALGEQFKYVATTKPGYEFLGWYTTEDEKYDFNTEVAADLQLFAKWEKKEYTVVFDYNGAPIDTESVQVAYNETVKSPATPTVEGSFFTGWYVKGTNEKFDFKTRITEDLTLVAEWHIDAYEVAFDGNDDAAENVPESFYVPCGDTIGDVPTPVLYGHKFTGWYTDKACTVPFDEATPIKANTTLYAGWTAKQYVIKYNMQGHGAQVAADGYNYNEVAKAPSVPVAEGYTFDGWYTDADCTDEYAFGAVTEDVLLYAKWVKNVYVVSFDGNSADATNVPEAQKVVYGDVVAPVAAPERTGYKFAGWYTDKACTAVFDAATAIKANVTLYAKWDANPYTVTFDMQGHGEQVEAQEVLAGHKADKPINPSEEGYSFVCWETEDGTPYNFNSVVTENIKLYAVWTTNEYVAYLDLMAEDADFAAGTMFPTAPYGKQFIRVATPSREGYVFAGWYTDSEYTNKYDWSTPATKDIVLYAKWDVKKFEIEFRTNNVKSDAPETQYIEYMKKATAPADADMVDKVGKKTFKFWSTDNKATSKDLDKAFDFNTKITEDIVLYAIWEKPHNVKYVAEAFVAGSASEIKTVGCDEAFKLSGREFTRKGYIHIGWKVLGHDIMAGNGTNYEFDEAVTYNDLCNDDVHCDSVTLVAVWRPINYTIVYNANGADKEPTNQIVKQNMAYNDMNPSEAGTRILKNGFAKTGYTFVGWNTKADGTGETVLPGQTLGITSFNGWDIDTNLADEEGSTVNLYAIWMANDYTVTFDANGGTGYMDDQQFKYDEAQNLNKLGYKKTASVFEGWATRPDGDVEFVDMEEVKNLSTGKLNRMLAADEDQAVVTLYAVWHKQPLLAQAKPLRHTNAVVTWNAIDGAVKYKVYGRYCGKKAAKYIKTVYADQTRKVTVKKLKRNKCYKFVVEAYDAEGNLICTSQSVHTVLGPGYNHKSKKANVISVATNFINAKMSVGETKAVKVKQAIRHGYKWIGICHTEEVRAISSNSSVAMIKQGVITAVGKGQCSIYIIASNGKYQKITITVK